MESLTRVQTLDEEGCVLVRANSYEKDMNQYRNEFDYH